MQEPTPAAHDTGLIGLCMLARFHGIAAEPAQLAHEFGEGHPFGETQILLAAKKLKLKAKRITKRTHTTAQKLATTPLPPPSSNTAASSAKSSPSPSPCNSSSWSTAASPPSMSSPSAWPSS